MSQCYSCFLCKPSVNNNNWNNCWEKKFRCSEQFHKINRKNPAIESNYNFIFSIHLFFKVVFKNIQQIRSIWSRFSRSTHAGRKSLEKIVIIINISVSTFTIVSFEEKIRRWLYSSCVKIRIMKKYHILS